MIIVLDIDVVAVVIDSSLVKINRDDDDDEEEEEEEGEDDDDEEEVSARVVVESTDIVVGVEIPLLIVVECWRDIVEKLLSIVFDDVYGVVVMAVVVVVVVMIVVVVVVDGVGIGVG
jgi:uncharacterized membrane protein YdbT with pleckstrin-like domain